MAEKAFRVEETGRTSTVWLMRPDRGNKLLTDEIRELGRAIRQAGSRDNDALAAFLRDTLGREGIRAELMRLKPAREGAQVLTPSDERCTFIENILAEKKVGI